MAVLAQTLSRSCQKNETKNISLLAVQAGAYCFALWLLLSAIILCLVAAHRKKTKKKKVLPLSSNISSLWSQRPAQVKERHKQTAFHFMSKKDSFILTVSTGTSKQSGLITVCHLMDISYFTYAFLHSYFQFLMASPCHLRCHLRRVLCATVIKLSFAINYLTQLIGGDIMDGENLIFCCIKWGLFN